MSFTANNVISPNIITLENTVSKQSNQIQQLIDLYSNNSNVKSYDQTTKQNVTVSFDQSTKRYRFEIQKNPQLVPQLSHSNQENDVFMYQVWEKNNDNLNSNRDYMYVSLRDWISEFKGKLNYTPTTLIEINNVFYPTVMVSSDIEQDNCVFYFDSSKITPPQGIVLQTLPQTGSYNNVRFDIDSLDNICGPTTAFNTQIFAYIPSIIYDSSGIKITRNSAYDKSYAYLSKLGQVKPITLILTTYCNITIDSTSPVFSNYFLFLQSYQINAITINNVFVSLEIYIDCNTYNLSIKDLFIDISYSNPTTQVNTGNPNIDPLVNLILNNNSHTINFKTPTCTFDLKTCDADGCTALVAAINEKVNVSYLPSVDLNNTPGNPSPRQIIDILCGNKVI